MAIYKLQPMVPQPLGSLGGTTFQRIGKSFAIRKRNKPVDKQTIKQFEKRQVFASVSTNWRELSAPDQATFIDEAPNYPRVNSLGNPYTITGDNLQQSSNVILEEVQQPQITTMPAPVVYPLAGFASNQLFYNIQTCLFAAIVVVIPANFIWQVWCSRPQPLNTINANAQYLLLHTYLSGEQPSLINVYDDFLNRFGDNPNYVGQFCFIRCRSVSLLTGQYDDFTIANVEVENL